MLLYAAFVVAAALWPFTFAAVCATCENHAVAGHGVSFPADGLIRSIEPARALAERIVASGSFTVELRLRPARTRQVGPARIVGMSDGPFRRNFTLGQEGRDLVFRLRTSETDPNGLKSEVAVGDVFRAGEERHLVVTWRPGAVEVFVDGRLRAALAGPAGRLDAWDPGYPLLLGNERSGNRPWLGTIDQVAIYDRVLSQAEVLDRYAASDGMAGLGRGRPGILRGAPLRRGRRAVRGEGFRGRPSARGPGALPQRGRATPARRAARGRRPACDAFRPDAAVRPARRALGARAHDPTEGSARRHRRRPCAGAGLRALQTFAAERSSSMAGSPVASSGAPSAR